MATSLLSHRRVPLHRSMLAAGLLAAAAPVAAQNVDLALLGTVHPGFRIDGIDEHDEFGNSVSGAGDVDGDGLADLVAGAKLADPGGVLDGGETYIVFGKGDTTTVGLASLGSGGFRLDGRGYSGNSVSGAGDVNGDGLADLVVGAYLADPGGRYNAGETYVVFGRADSTATELASLGSGGFRIDGAHAYDSSGLSVSGAGDVNGDGLADLVVGVPVASSGGVVSAGETYVVFGKADSETVDLASLGAGGFRIDGIDAYDNSGWSVSGAGDVNGDGLADLVVGAPFVSPGGDACVVFGKADSATVDLASLGSGGFRMDGIDAHDESGFSVSGAGDVNGDGRADLVVGAPLADADGDFHVGETYVVFGKTDSTTVDLASLGTGGFRIGGEGNAGFSVSGAGDVNADGLADLVVGAPFADRVGAANVGGTYVVFGKGDSTTVDLASLGSGGFRIDGVDAGDLSGTSVSGAGDVDGDGLADVVVGAPGAFGDRSVPLPSRGASYVVFSPATPPTVQPLAPTSATYKSTAPAGNAPRVAAGISGDGSDDDSPSSRCWIDFDAGTGNGSKQSSMQTVTLTRNHAGIRVLKPERLANVQWRIQTDRTGQRRTRVTLKYTDAEIAGLREETLRVWRASSPRGPWALYSYGMVREPQRNRIGVVVPSLGYFVIEGEPAAP